MKLLKASTDGLSWDKWHWYVFKDKNHIAVHLGPIYITFYW